MISRLAQLRHSRFLRSAGTLSGGQFIAMALSFGFAPILSRLYAPADYGVLATYTSVAVILAAVANLHMSRALVAEAEEAVATALLGLSLILACGFTLLTLGGVGAAWLAGVSGIDQVGLWLMLLPATVLASGTGSALLGWANRHHRYRLMSGYQIVNVVVSSGGALLFALGGYGAAGLMIGYFLGQLLSLLWVWVGTRDMAGALRGLSWAQMRAAGSKHRKYAQWSTPTAILEQVSAASPVLVLSLWGNMLAIVGHYNRARGLLMLPVGILGAAISQVFFRRAAQDMASDGNCRRLFWKMIVGVSLISVPTFIVLAIIAPSLFVFVLGPQWDEAGHIARILAPVMALQLVVLPAGKVMLLYGRQRLDFFLSILFAASTTFAVAAVAFLGFAPEIAIDVFAGVQILMYLAYLAASILIVERDHRTTRDRAAAAAVIQP